MFKPSERDVNAKKNIKQNKKHKSVILFSISFQLSWTKLITVGCGAVWYHRGPNGPIRALIGNQYPPRTFKSTKNILSDPFDPFCYPKPAQTVKIDVLLKYCLKSEKAVRIQIHLTDVLGRINCLSASQRLFRASEVILDIFEALTESKRSTYSLKSVKRSGG